MFFGLAENHHASPWALSKWPSGRFSGDNFCRVQICLCLCRKEWAEDTLVTVRQLMVANIFVLLPLLSYVSNCPFWSDYQAARAAPCGVSRISLWHFYQAKYNARSPYIRRIMDTSPLFGFTQELSTITHTHTHKKKGMPPPAADPCCHNTNLWDSMTYSTHRYTISSRLPTWHPRSHLVSGSLWCLTLLSEPTRS